MKKIIDPFLYNVPHIDLHGYDRSGAVAMLQLFINENKKIDNKKIVVIHGKGSGILKNAIHEYLKKDKNILDFKINNYNDGETIIILK